MKINITVEVKDRASLVELLQTGKAYSLLDYKIIDFNLNPDFDILKRQEDLNNTKKGKLRK